MEGILGCDRPTMHTEWFMHLGTWCARAGGHTWRINVDGSDFQPEVPLPREWIHWSVLVLRKMDVAGL